MKAMRRVGLLSPVTRISLVLALLVAGTAAAQPCPPGTTIPNFRFVNSSQDFPRQVTYAWDAPSGAAADTTYQVLRAVAGDYCSPFSAFTVIAETTSRNHTVTLETADRVYQFWVRVKGCDTAAPGSWVDDSFVLTPTPPVLRVSGSTANQVMLTFSQGDSRTAAVVLERAGADGRFRQLSLIHISEPTRPY